MTHKHTFPLTFLLIVLLLGGLVSFPPATQAGSTLPPRNTPTPTPDEGKDHQKDKPAGATIELEVPPAWASAWAVVQWRSAEGWHKVEGWRGSLPESGRWWVAAKDFGAGPFRWLVTQGPGGPALGVSEPFYLPQFPNETRQVRVGVK
jgi:hypothetical protein